MALVRAGPPFPPAPAAQTMISGFVVSRTLDARAGVVMSSREDTKTESFPGWEDWRARISGSWSGFRTTEVTFQDFARRRGVR